jgi:hypothetical protein
MMPRFKISFALLVSIALLSGCSAESARTFTPMDPLHPEVTVYDNATVQAHTCSVIWACVFGNVTAPEPCEGIEFAFDVLDSESGKVLASQTKSYWGKVKAGVTDVEWGINNALPKSVSFSKPSATCLTEKPNPEVAKSMATLPASFCEGDSKSYCSAESPSGWELRRIRLEQEAKDNFVDLDPGNGYTVLCNDGWVSESGGIQGACSHHGGVAG